MYLHLGVARAVFQADGKPDAEVRVLPDPAGGVSFSINFGGTDVMNSGFVRRSASSSWPSHCSSSPTRSVRVRPLTAIRPWLDQHRCGRPPHREVKGFWEDGVGKATTTRCCA